MHITLRKMLDRIEEQATKNYDAVYADGALETDDRAAVVEDSLATAEIAKKYADNLTESERNDMPGNVWSTVERFLSAVRHDQSRLAMMEKP